jgi:hypothetical protein
MFSMCTTIGSKIICSTGNKETNEPVLPQKMKIRSESESSLFKLKP